MQKQKCDRQTDCQTDSVTDMTIPREASASKNVVAKIVVSLSDVHAMFCEMVLKNVMEARN